MAPPLNVVLPVTDLTDLLNDISSSPHPNPNLSIVGGDTLAQTTAYPKPLPDIHHVYFTAFVSPNQWNNINPKPPLFQDYKKYFGTNLTSTGLLSIESNTMLSYDAMLALLYASQKGPSTKSTIRPSDLTLALKQITVANPIQGVTGRIAFDSNGDQAPSKMIFIEHIAGTNLVIDEKHGCLQKDNCGS